MLYLSWIWLKMWNHQKFFKRSEVLSIYFWNDLFFISGKFHGDRDIEMIHFIFRTIWKKMFFCTLLAFFTSNFAENFFFWVVSYQEVNLGTASFLSRRRSKVLYSFLFLKPKRKYVKVLSYIHLRLYLSRLLEIFTKHCWHFLRVKWK